MKNDLKFPVASLLQHGNGSRLILVGKHLSCYHFLLYLLRHLTRFCIYSKISHTIQFHHTIRMRLYMNGNNLIIIERFHAQVHYAIRIKIMLGTILNVSLIGINLGHVKESHIIIKTYNISLIIHTKIERTSSF